MTIEHLMRAVRYAAAANGPGALSAGEAVAAALVLNRPDWLADMGYTIAQALDRIDEGDADLIPRAEKQWRSEVGAQAQVAAIAARAHRVADFFTEAPDGDTGPLDLAAQLVTYGEAPGYRDANLVFDVQPIGCSRPERTQRISMRIRPQDAESIVFHIVRVHRFAWSRPGGRPLDAKEGEKRPAWIDGPI